YFAGADCSSSPRYISPRTLCAASKNSLFRRSTESGLCLGADAVLDRAERDRAGLLAISRATPLAGTAELVPHARFEPSIRVGGASSRYEFAPHHLGVVVHQAERDVARPEGVLADLGHRGHLRGRADHEALAHSGQLFRPDVPLDHLEALRP